LLDGGADAIGGEVDTGLSRRLSSAAVGFKGVFGFRAALGAAEVGHEDEAAAAVEDVFDRRQRLGDAAVVGDFSIFDGDVEIDAHQNFLPRTSMSATVFLAMNAP
jgi:hypothetical protein